MADPEDFRSTLVLTEIRGERSPMWLAIHLTYALRLVIEGHDLGDTEHEFERKLGVEETARVAELLGVSVAALLPAIQERRSSRPTSPTSPPCTGFFDGSVTPVCP